MVQETHLDEEEFVDDDVYDSDMNPVHKWQIAQVVESPSIYATDPSNYDGAPEPSDAEVSPEVTEEAREEYVESRGVMPGTGMANLLERKEPGESEDTVDPYSIIGM